MPFDAIVNCLFCREAIYFINCYVTRNGDRSDTFECIDEIACAERARQRGLVAGSVEARELALDHGSVSI